MMKKMIILIVALILMSILYSCGSVQYVPVETVKTDSVYINKYTRDSIFFRDSVFVKEKGDTVYVDRYRYKYVDKVIFDTIYTERIDTIRVPVPVEKKISSWRRFKDAAALMCTILVVVIISGYFIFKTAR